MILPLQTANLIGSRYIRPSTQLLLLLGSLIVNYYRPSPVGVPAIRLPGVRGRAR